MEEIEQPEQQEKRRQQRLRSPRAQCQQVIDELSDLAQSANAKPNNRTDALLRKSELLVELMKISAKEKESEALAENETLKQQHEQDSAKIAELQTRVDSLTASQHPVEIRTVPDPETPQLRADLKLKDDILNAIAEAVKSSLSHPQRINFAAVLVTKYGRACQSFLNQVTDFSLIWCASQKRDEELQEIISLAQPNARGDGCLVSRALLAARGVPVVGPQQKPHFKNEFE